MERIERGALVERSPCLRFLRASYEEHAKHTLLEHYLFVDQQNRDMLLALGVGSLFNHSESPNLSYILDSKTDTIRFYTCRAIDAGEELFIFYGEDLWFDPQ